MKIEDIYTLKEELFQYMESSEEWTSPEISQMKATIEIFVSFLTKKEFSIEYVLGVKKYLLGGVPENSVKFRAIEAFYQDMVSHDEAEKEKAEESAMFEESMR